MATFWVYDCACSLQEEWTFLLQSRWTKVKGLYIATRCVPFLLLMGHLYMNFIPNENPDVCELAGDFKLTDCHVTLAEMQDLD
ncbi:hypothetical protein F4604DRAFT_78911 [Suillus subluteus]|nr:hypothetical protein F4604DRAFT_78911 [Suillus subluteus]